MMTEYRENVLLLCLYRCGNKELMNNPSGLRRLVRTAAEKSGATVFGTHIKKYPGRGINATADIGESIIVLQTWEERGGYVSVVFHSSYSSVEPKKSVDHIARRLKAETYEMYPLEGPELPPIDEDFI